MFCVGFYVHVLVRIFHLRCFIYDVLLMMFLCWMFSVVVWCTKTVLLWPERRDEESTAQHVKRLQTHCLQNGQVSALRLSTLCVT